MLLSGGICWEATLTNRKILKADRATTMTSTATSAIRCIKIGAVLLLAQLLDRDPWFTARGTTPTVRTYHACHLENRVASAALNQRHGVGLRLK
ncbi:MAG: hypothetical protein DWH84_01355 [Planctomycetota bacterium]|nr:MAG: hypothetical protein DWH84_01355 [Planctomycetota bacterium]